MGYLGFRVKVLGFMSLGFKTCFLFRGRPVHPRGFLNQYQGLNGLLGRVSSTGTGHHRTLYKCFVQAPQVSGGCR